MADTQIDGRTFLSSFKSTQEPVFQVARGADGAARLIDAQFFLGSVERHPGEIIKRYVVIRTTVHSGNERALSFGGWLDDESAKLVKNSDQFDVIQKIMSDNNDMILERVFAVVRADGLAPKPQAALH